MAQALLTTEYRSSRRTKMNEQDEYHVTLPEFGGCGARADEPATDDVAESVRYANPCVACPYNENGQIVDACIDCKNLFCQAE